VEDGWGSRGPLVWSFGGPLESSPVTSRLFGNGQVGWEAENDAMDGMGGGTRGIETFERDIRLIALSH